MGKVVEVSYRCRDRKWSVTVTSQLLTQGRRRKFSRACLTAHFHPEALLVTSGLGAQQGFRKWLAKWAHDNYTRQGCG